MTTRVQRAIARSVFGASVALFAAGLVGTWLVRSVSSQNGWNGNGGPIQNLMLTIGLGSFCVVGFVLASRRPASPIGWLLLTSGFFWSLTASIGKYTQYGYAIHRVPGRLMLMAVSQWVWVPAVGLPAIFGVLLFPDGHLPSTRWRWLARTGGIAIVAGSIGTVFSTSTPLSTGGTPAEVPNPLASVPGAAILNLFGLGIFVMLLCIIAAAVSLVMRLRRSTGELREQLRWLAYAGVVVGVIYCAAVIVSTMLSNSTATWLYVVQFSILFVFALIPVSIGFAVLKYRLYDIDVVISKTIVFGGLAAFITAVYVAVVVGIGSLIGSTDNVGLSIAATAIVAALFQPVRDRVRRVANRFVYGERATPYEVVAGFATSMSETISTNDILPKMAEAAGAGVGAVEAAVTVDLPGRDPRVERWRSMESGRRGEAFSLEIDHQGARVGQLTIVKSANDPLLPAERGLLEDLAAQAGLALYNVRLTDALAARLAEQREVAEALRLSRERLVTARDTQRRGLRRDIHEGPERQLQAIAHSLQILEAGADPAEVDALIEAANATLEGLRDLARGIFPPLLADKGVVAALEAHIRKVGANASVEAAPGFAGRRFDADTEACVYFCCLQALQNVVRHAGNAPAVVSLGAGADDMTFEVRDAGPGFDAETTAQGMGIQIMQDRVGALGGELSVQSTPGSGTAVRGVIQVHTADRAGAPT